MRDPGRMEPMLAALRTAWLANPDQRLGQLVCNASRSAGGDVDPFNTEDDVMHEGLVEQVARGFRPEGFRG